MHSSSHSDTQQHSYSLDSKVPCPKHPAKTIQFFCRHPDCQQKLYCSNCILKKQTCLHDQQIVDINEYLYTHKQFYESKGLSTNIQMCQFYNNLPSSRKQYQFMIENQFNKFDNEVDKLMQQMKQIINSMRANIKSQLNSYIETHNRVHELLIQCQVNLQKRLNESFSFTFHSEYNTFQQIFRKNQHKTLEGLKQLLTKFNAPVDQSYYKDTKQQLKNLLSLQIQSPQIDYSQYQNIKLNLKLFQKKLSQTGSSIINLKSPLKSSRTKWVSSFSVKKMKIVNKFSSYHTSTISAIGAIDNNIFIGAQNGQVRVFDGENYQCLTAFKAHDGSINSIKSSNKNLITASDDKTIKIWNFSQPIKMKLGNYSPDIVLKGHTLAVITIQLVSDHLVASGGADLTLRLWDLKDGSSKSYSGHLNNVLCLTSNLLGTTVISGSADKTIKLWRVEKRSTMICQKTLSGHHDSVISLILTNDDNTLYSCSLDKFIRVWSLYNGQCTKIIPSQHSGFLADFQLFTNNLLLSSSSDGCLRFWDLDTNTCVYSIDANSSIGNLVIIDKTIFITGEDKMISICQ